MSDDHNPLKGIESGDLSQPLQLRRGSTAKERKDILDKYNQKLNESVEDTIYNQPKSFVNAPTNQ
jgi:hypothetical protein